MLGGRRGKMMDLQDTGQGSVRLIYIVPTRGLLGFRYQFLTATRGMGVMNALFHGLRGNGRADGTTFHRFAGGLGSR